MRPDPADAGLLARQAEIEELEKRCSELAQQAAERGGRAGAAGRRRLRAAARRSSRRALRHRAAAEGAARRADRGAQARPGAGALPRAQQPDPRRAGRGRAAPRDRDARGVACEPARRAARIGEEIARRAQAARGGARGAASPRRARSPAQRQRGAAGRARGAGRAVRRARDARSKIAEIDNSVRVIDQQIGRADAEVGAARPRSWRSTRFPRCARRSTAAVEARIACEKNARRSAQRGRSRRRRAARARGRAAAGRVARRAAARAHRRAAPEGAGGADQLRPVRLAAARGRRRRGAARQPKRRGAPRASSAAGRDHAPHAGDQRARRGEPGGAGGARHQPGAQGLPRRAVARTWRRRCARWRTRSAASTARRASCCARPSTRVNRHFGSLFPALFGGGEAKLSMTGEEILDAGVQVMAHPPGKRNASIHLLSGGEKALTAIALVFSLFQLNPAPFCLLDEVDAPLDDSQHACASATWCERMSAQTQFLFISHNKITMEMATPADRRHHAGVRRVARGRGRHRGSAAHPGGARRLRFAMSDLSARPARVGAAGGRRRAGLQPRAGARAARAERAFGSDHPDALLERRARRRRGASRVAARAGAAAQAVARRIPAHRLRHRIRVRPAAAPALLRGLERDRAPLCAARDAGAGRRTSAPGAPALQLVSRATASSAKRS